MESDENIRRNIDERFRQLLETLPSAILLINSAGIILLVNQHLEDLFGYPRHELIGMSVDVLLPQRFRQDHTEHRPHFFAHPEARPMGTGMALVGQRKNGSEFPVDVGLSYLETEQGTLAVANVTDISERQHLMDQLEQSRYFSENIIKRIPYLLYVYDLTDEHDIYINQTFLPTLGYSASEIKQMGTGILAQLLHPDDLLNQQNSLNRFAIATDEEVLLTEFRFRHANGTYRWLQIREMIFSRTPEGLPQKIMGIAHDITPRKETELALITSEKRYRQVIEHQTDLICRYNQDFTLTFVNQAYCDNFGKTLQEVIGQNLLAMIPDEDKESAIANVRTLTRENPTSTSRHRSFTVDGSIRWFEWVDLAIFDDAGQFIEYQGVGRDITDRIHAQMLQAELAQERELHEMKTRFLTTVSHEFRTPMTVISTSVTLLKDYFEKMTPAQRAERIDKVLGQIKQLTHLLDNMTFLNRPDDKPHKLHPTALDIETMLQHIIEDVTEGNGIQVELVMHGNANGFISDEFLFQQIFMNVIDNAIKFSKPQGMVQVVCQCNPAKIEVEVVDHGIGILPEDRDHIYEPFYRGGNVGTIRGTGLGLTIVKIALEQHGGTIDFTTQPDIGTTFTVTLPTLS